MIFKIISENERRGGYNVYSSDEGNMLLQE
jgi:hypothetical protein